jgi:murein DD-endopeptidase MepM/ murein hydrolase activator NlpD
LNTKPLHKIIVSVIAVLLISAPSFAFNVETTPQPIVPGDIFLLKIQTDKPGSVEAEFLGESITFSPIEKGQLISLVPVDINTKPGEYIISVKEGEKTQSALVIVSPHEFETINLTLPEGKVTLSPENQKRVEKEYILQKKIWDKSTNRSWQGQFIYPLDTEISTEFGVKRIMNKKKTSVHRGTDFRGKTGTPVRALNSGTVVLSEDLFYGGNTLIIDHGMGLYSVYMHLSKFNTKKGEKVSKGDLVGFVGSSGRATGPHLHLSVKLNGISVNPESLFKLALQ